MTRARPFAPWRLLALLVVLVGAPRFARADPFHFQGIPLGQRAIGLGGAFTGLADDPSAAYYNPAGLVWGGDSALSATFTLNAFDRQTIARGYRTALGDSTLTHDSDPSLPVSGGFLKELGRRNELGERRHAIAVSTFTIDQRRLNFDIQIRDAAPTGIATLSVDRSTVTHWQGVSYAYRASGMLSFGFSGFLSLTRSSYRDDLISASLGAVDPSTGSYDSDAGSWESHRSSSDVKSLVMRAGVLFQYSPRLRLGLMLQPPSIHVKGTASVRERSLDLAMNGGSGKFLNADQGSLTARYPIPWEIRGGLSYRPRGWLTLTFDGSLYGRDGSPRRQVVFIGPRSANAQTGAVARLGDFELERSYRRMSGNVAVGAEAHVGKRAAIRAGLFTSMSSAPSIPRTSDTYMAPDIHRVGFSLSAGVDMPGFDCSLGTAGLFGRGDAVALDSRPEALSPYHRTSVRDATLFIFITGMRSAVARLVKTAEERLRDLRGPAAEDATAAAPAIEPAKPPAREPDK